ncbi:hypothetical protein CRUP_011509 [Coryphaenoides rupestris]|nr:hypothetical protein CRUP_011509 [Coryphaenoides rupestris]
MEKTRELFQMCDLEGKGSVTRWDMQRLTAEVPLNPDELENVFDTLDKDGNATSPSTNSLLVSPVRVCSPSEVRSLWAQLSRDEPHLLANFEEFLARVTARLREADQEKSEMESAMKRKAATHDDEIQSLYEEMELQIKNEQERILMQDSEHFMSRSQDLEGQLSSKESELDQLFQKQKREANRLYSPGARAQAAEAAAGGPALRTRGHLQRIISIEEDHLPQLLQAPPPLQAWNEGWSEGEEGEEATEEQWEENADSQAGDTPTSPRGQPVGKETSFMEEASVLPPDRLFKIILTIQVDNSQVALQVWDTAGQERYRSITKQFFRRADAVVVMYDITSEASFSGVRQWLTSVQEGADEEIPIMLLGNKTDKESEREIQAAVGERLAKDSELLFYECSACSGHGVGECMVDLAR